MITILKWVSTHLLAVLGAGGLIYGLLVAEHTKKIKEEADKTVAALVAVEAAKRGGVEGQLVAQIKANEKQAEFIKALQKIDSRVRAVEQSKTTVAIADQPAGHVTAPALGTSGPSFWADDYHRFRLDLPSGPFHRRQFFSLDAVIVAGPAGQRIEKSAFHELDPETKQEIPLIGVDLKTDFQFVRESGPAISPWHIRALAALDHRLGVGVGLAINPWRPLTLAGMGLYSPKNEDGRLALFAGWRPADFTVSLGGYIGVSLPSGVLVGGGAVVLELTR